nr:hypothetical protein [Angustibacter aerolatus]
MTATLTSPPPAVDEAAPTPPRGRAVRLLRGPGATPRGPARRCSACSP